MHDWTLHPTPKPMRAETTRWIWLLSHQGEPAASLIVTPTGESHWSFFEPDGPRPTLVTSRQLIRAATRALEALGLESSKTYQVFERVSRKPLSHRFTTFELAARFIAAATQVGMDCTRVEIREVESWKPADRCVTLARATRNARE